MFSCQDHHRTTFATSLLLMWLLTWSTVVAAGSWHSDQFAYQSHNYTGIASNAERFVAVAATVVTTGSIGEAPTICRLPLSMEPAAVARNSWHFMVVGRLVAGTDTGVILASPDGRRWNEVFRTQGRLRGIAWGNGQWLAVGDRGLVVGSSTLRDWQHIDVREHDLDSLRHAVWATDRWIAVGASGADLEKLDGWVVTSPDGYSWTTTTRLSGKNMERIAWNGSVAVTAPDCLHSSDGLTWQSGGDCEADDVVWDGQQFVAVDEWVFHHALGTTLTSSDGLAWEIVEDWGVPKRAVSWNGSHYLAAGEGSLVRSEDLVSWHAAPQTLAPQWIADITTTDCGINAIGNSQTPQGGGFYYPEPFLASLDEGQVWNWSSFSGAGDCTVVDLASMGTLRVVSCRDADYLLVSDDCQRWSAVPFRCGGAYCPARGLSGSEVGFVLVADDGWILHSLDGRDWSSQLIEEIHRFDAVTWTGEQLIAAGDTGIATSTDGRNWDFHEVPEMSYTRAMASDAHRVVRISSTGIFTTLDLIHWTPVARDLDQDFYDLIWTGDEFVAVGEYGGLATSANGVLWTLERSGFPVPLYAAHEVGDRLFVGGRSLMAHRDPTERDGGDRSSPR